MPTHKDQHGAWPCHSGLSPSLFLFCLSLCLSLPSPPEGGRVAPRALATADVTGASYDNVFWGMSHKPLQSQTAFQMKKSPFTSLMDGVMVIIIAVLLFLIQVV